MNATETKAAIETGQMVESGVISVQETAIKLPNQIRERIERRLKKSEFSTVDAYAAYILEEVLNELENDENNPPNKTEAKENDVFSKKDQEDVEQRLRDLGYL